MLVEVFDLKGSNHSPFWNDLQDKYLQSIFLIIQHLEVANMNSQKKKYGNSNIAPCKHIIFQKSSKRNQNPFKIL